MTGLHGRRPPPEGVHVDYALELALVVMASVLWLKGDRARPSVLFADPARLGPGDPELQGIEV